MSDTIFVQIASYRDPELVPTVLDMFENAVRPENLHVCICWQHDDSENIDVLRKHPNIEIIDVPYYESKGACWARNQIQLRYNNEDYTLQLDSHHRFVQNWDETLLKMYQQCQSMGSKKPLITAYIPSFNPFDPKEKYEHIPWKMDFHKFLLEGAIFFIPSPIENHEQFTAPIPARFYSAHFAFTVGKFCNEVRHDPEYYFYGEEISIAVRAFTHGYDLYHPHKVVCWHEYTRSARFKHWDDHDMSKADIKNIKQSWWERDAHCQKRNRVLFRMEDDPSIKIVPLYNFGTERSLEDYEKYAGVRFKTKEVSVYTLSGNLAPTPYTENYVSGSDIENLKFDKVSKSITIERSSFLKHNDINQIILEIVNKEGKVMIANTFNQFLVNIWKTGTNDVVFDVEFNTTNATDVFFSVIKFYDSFGRMLMSVKKEL